MSKLANVFSKKEKKELTPKQQKVRNILNWVVNIVSVIIIVFALVYAVLTIVRVTNANNVTGLFGKAYLNVMSDSMEPTFSKGDVIISENFNGDVASLKLGQVVTFKDTRNINGTSYEIFNTHRIIKISENYVYTRGDNDPKGKKDGQDWKEHLDSTEGTTYERVSVDKIVAVWGDVDDELNFTPGKILKGAGVLSNWMQDPVEGRTRFFCIIVLPLILLFVAYAFVLVRAIVIAKVESAKAVKADTTVTVDSLSDEEKRRLAEEYLASLAKEKQDSAPQEPAEAPVEDAPADAPAEDLPTPEEVAKDSNETLE